MVISIFKKILPVIFLFVSNIVFCQTPGKASEYEFVEDVDSSAEYPGGLRKFYKDMQNVMIYPHDARVAGVEGKTFVQFIVNTAGHIITNSVKTIKELHPSCDAEAVRVVKACATQWKPAMKNGKGVNQQFVLPIAFKLTDEPLYPWRPVENPIKAVVIPKTFTSSDGLAWTLYSDSRMRMVSGQILIGDSVHVTGWAPYAYFIKTRTSSGYVSWKALEVTDELKLLSFTIANRSAIEELEIEKLDSVEVATAVANAFLSISANKNNIYVGECVTLTLAFHIADDNKVGMQFYELGSQLANIISTQLTLENCWIINGRVEDIQGISSKNNGENYTSYPIFKASYCPENAGSLTIPSIKLQMAKVKPVSKNVDSLIIFASSRLAIKINPLPAGLTPTASDGYKLVGNFELSDSLHSKSVTVGEPVTYAVTIRGKGLAYPIQPPKIEMENAEYHLLDILDTDTLVDNQLQSSKTFVYQLIFQQAGSYDFREKISLLAFNPTTKNLRKLTSTSKVTVSEGVKSKTVIAPKNFGSMRNFIAIDASRSMEIEDYKPHRLGAVKLGLKQFLLNRETCDIGLMLFGGDAKHFTLATPGKCYTEHFIDSVDFGFTAGGTAIGDAIWLANNSFADTGAPKKLVIIGDGDNTAGHLPPKFAAALAKKHNVKIYSIGVGTSGLVPYGRDHLGRSSMIENTFTDKDLKTIASITNGQYFWAKDAQEVNRLLKIIFSSP